MAKKATLKLGSKEFYQLVGQSAVLRGQGRFDEAIALIEPQLVNMEPDAQLNGLLELLYAAAEAGYRQKALQFALTLAKIDPNIPSVKRVLAQLQPKQK